MTSERVRINVLCEDREHEQFMRRLLREYYGVTGKIWFDVAPSGRGSAAQWVVARYADLCAKARATRHQARLGFVVVVDGDSVGLAHRLQELDDVGESRRDGTRLAALVPTWSIETWVKWLTDGFSEDEDPEVASHKNDVSGSWKSLLPRAIAAWHPPEPQEPERIPSLTHARSELSHLPV